MECKNCDFWEDGECHDSDEFIDEEGVDSCRYREGSFLKPSVNKSGLKDGLEGDDCRETSAKMDKKEALAIMAGANDWLRKKLNEGAACTCGACYLCAYRFIEEAL